jgi:hypothetical protein
MTRTPDRARQHARVSEVDLLSTRTRRLPGLRMPVPEWLRKFSQFASSVEVGEGDS